MTDAVMDVYIRPQLGNTQLLDYHKEKLIVEIGYKAAKVKLTEWKLINPNYIPVATESENQSKEISPSLHASGGTGVDSNLSLPAASASLLSRSQTIASSGMQKRLPLNSTTDLLDAAVGLFGPSLLGDDKRKPTLARAMSSEELTYDAGNGPDSRQ